MLASWYERQGPAAEVLGDLTGKRLQVLGGLINEYYQTA
jgi:hypothetical protein